MVQTGVRLKDRQYTQITPDETIRPLRDQIIVKPLDPKWSPLIAIAYNGEALRGRVVATGPGCFPNVHARGKRDGKDYHSIRQSKIFRPTEVKVGDIVELGGAEIGGYLWTHVSINGEDHILCREQDVCGIAA